jgi:succinate dehydrogenase / fumarate reductase cytochrome b subunit
MGSFGNAFSSSIGKKLIMGITGLFLISFLVVHCFINSFVFFDNDGGLTFNDWCSFYGNKLDYSGMEVVCLLGLLASHYSRRSLNFENQAARPVKYA